MMLDVLHKHGDLRLEGRRIARKLGKLGEQNFHLSVLFQPLSDDLFQILITLVEQVRVEDRLFDMRMDIQLFLDLPERRRVIPVFVLLYLFEQILDFPVIGLQKVDRVRSTGFKDLGYCVDRGCDDTFAVRSRATL